MKAILIVLLSILASLGSHAQTRPMDQSVTKALTAYDQAWNKKDVAGVSAVLAEDYVYFTSTGGLTDRKRTLEFLASPDYQLTFVERSEIVLHSIVGDTAIVSSRWKGRGKYGKEEISDDQRCGLVFLRQKNMWKLLSEHCAQIVAK